MASSKSHNPNAFSHCDNTQNKKYVDRYTSVLVCTGNLLLNEDLKRKIHASSTEEFISGVLWTLEHESLENAISKSELKILETKDNQTTEDDKSSEILLIDPGDCCHSQAVCGSTKTTCKLFSLGKSKCTVLQDAMPSALKYLDVEAIDLLILSPLPLCKDDGFPLCASYLQEWQLAEKMVDDGSVKSLGTSDFDLDSLECLTEKIRIKPVSNQVSKEMCCSIPTDLNEYVEKNSIQLLTHNDKAEILDKTEIERLEKALENYTKTDHSYTLEWLIRYSVMIGSKGIIDKKGYMANFKRVDIQ